MSEPTSNQTLDIQGTINSYKKVAFWKFWGAVALGILGYILSSNVTRHTFLDGATNKLDAGDISVVAFAFSFVFAASLAFSKQTYIYLDFTDRQIVTVEHYAWFETSKRCRPLTEAQLTEAQTAAKRTKVGWAMGWAILVRCAIQLACLLLTAAGSLAVQAGWMRCEWPWIFDTLFVLQVVAIVLEDSRLTPKRKAEPGAAPNSGPTTPSGSSGVAGGPPSVS